jgi:two-component system chemotaxis response regulator CheB
VNNAGTHTWKGGRAVPGPGAGGAARSPYSLVVVAASTGGVKALEQLLGSVPEDFPLPIAIVQHRSSAKPNLLARVLSRHSSLRVKTVEEGETMHPGTVYLAPPDMHINVAPGLRVSLLDGRRVRHVRSSANPLFESAAQALGGRVIAVVLTGYDRDATDGVQSVKGAGGIVFAQDEATSQVFDMPRAAIETGCVDRVLPLPEIGPALVALARGR